MNTIDVEISGYVGETKIDAAFTGTAQIIGISGASGAGKTSLLHMIAGLTKPVSGHIKLAGTTLFDSAANFNQSTAARSIGYVFQDHRLFPHLSVRNNLIYASKAKGMAIDKSFHEIVDMLDIASLMQRSPKHLSGGEKQRVAIGRALLSQPKMLILDEALTSVDQTRRKTIIKFLKQVPKQRNIPIIYISHDAEELADTADNIVTMSGGIARNLEPNKASIYS